MLTESWAGDGLKGHCLTIEIDPLNRTKVRVLEKPALVIKNRAGAMN